jgi:hypothetical protein
MDGHALRQWSARYLSALDGLKDVRRPMYLHRMMIDAGLVDIESRTIQLPLCGWSRGMAPNC